MFALSTSYFWISRCGAGHFGLELTDACTPCDCNGHINVNDEGACDATSGECLKCLDNTSGDQCQYCAETFFLDGLSNQCLSK